MNSWITVVIPVYNRVFELERCLISLQNQTIKDFKVIVCDDGSDNGYQIKTLVQSFNEKLNISYITIENTGGPATPRNIGVSYCTNEWIAFLDSDDTWSKCKLESIKEFINEYDFIYHKMTVINNLKKTRRIIGDAYTRDDLPFQIMTKGNNIPTSSVVIKKIILQDYKFDQDKKIISYEDVDLWLRLFHKKNIKIKFINKVLGFYYISQDSISKPSMKQVKYYLNFYNKNKILINSNEIKHLNNYKNNYLGTLFYQLNKNKIALKYLIKASDLKSFKENVKKTIKIIILLKRIYL